MNRAHRQTRRLSWLLLSLLALGLIHPATASASEDHWPDPESTEGPLPVGPPTESGEEAPLLDVGLGALGFETFALKPFDPPISESFELKPIKVSVDFELKPIEIAQGVVETQIDFSLPPNPFANRPISPPLEGDSFEPPYDPWHEVRMCESSGSYTAINPNDTDGTPSYGGYQFKQTTWDWVVDWGGRPELMGIRPDRAAPADQDWAAETLRIMPGGGLGHWPYCGQFYGT